MFAKVQGLAAQTCSFGMVFLAMLLPPSQGADLNMASLHWNLSRFKLRGALGSSSLTQARINRIHLLEEKQCEHVRNVKVIVGHRNSELGIYPMFSPLIRS